MSILVIFTGGTIGSTVSDGYISTDASKTYKLLELYKPRNHHHVTFDIVEPYTLLSENLTGEHLALLGKCVKEHMNKPYDGIIITHGTDTIQYSAAALQYSFPDLNVPVMLVSSNYVLEDPASNGLDNFHAAVEFIMAKAGKGVFVPYKNNDGVVYVHKGTRLLWHLPCNDDLHSVINQYYGTMEADDTFVPNDKYTQNNSSTEELALPSKWNSGILRIFPYPGMFYPNLNKLDPLKAILLETYHSGTLCSVTPGMQRFLETASIARVPVFLSGANGGLDYESVKIWKELQVITLPLISPVAVYIKLWMTLEKYSSDVEKVKEIMGTPIGDDIIPR